jgi:hypothetical protein
MRFYYALAILFNLAAAALRRRGVHSAYLRYLMQQILLGNL